MIIAQQDYDNCYAKIDEMSKGKAQKFIHHLVKAFLPIDELAFYMNTDQKCAISGKLGFSVKRYCDMTEETLFLKAQIILAKTEEEKAPLLEKYNKIIQSVRDYWNLEEGEDIYSRKLYYSEKSDVCLTKVALVALRDWKINNLLTSGYVSERRQPRPEPKHPVIQSPQMDTLGDSNKDAFEKLKNLFK
jgi:hypothetical protein